MKEKPIEWEGNSLDDLRSFPGGIINDLGYQLGKVQNGMDPADWKPMHTVGPGAMEIRVKDASGKYRVIYVAKFEDAIHVLHCFQKKSRTTPKRDIDLAKKRYKEIGI